MKLDIKGFSPRNLWNMRKLYVTYQNSEKLQPLVAEIKEKEGDYNEKY